jgi:ribosomal protein S27E
LRYVLRDTGQVQAGGTRHGQTPVLRNPHADQPPSPIAVAPAYQRHRPEQTALYSIISEHYPHFVREIERVGGHLPGFVRQEFEDYLKCGLLQHGFLRVKCDGCLHEHLVAFSCKRRGFCPSCGPPHSEFITGQDSQYRHVIIRRDRTQGKHRQQCVRTQIIDVPVFAVVFFVFGVNLQFPLI